MNDKFSFNPYRLSALGLAIVALSLSGCATELTFRRREALDAFVGMDRSDLVARLGQPTRVAAQPDGELLTYNDSELKWQPGEPGVRTSDNIPIGPWVEKAHCATTFRVSGGRVDAWRLDGNDCRNPAFPNLGGAETKALAEAAQSGVNQTTDFTHNGFTGRSIVNYGEFQSR